MSRMKTLFRRPTSLILLALLPVLALSYQNCAGAYSAKTSGGGIIASESAGTCDQVILNSYKKSVYPFFRSVNTCMNCHIEGGIGLGLFASADVDASYAAFSAAGLTKISYMATNPQHKPPFTGDQNKPQIDAINTLWVKEQQTYMDCVSKAENGGVNESLLTSPKQAQSIYGDSDAPQTLSWDLDFATDVDESNARSLPAKITIDVKVLYQTINGRVYAKGYIFSNPTLQMKDSSKQMVVEGLFVQINKKPISSQTTYTNLSRVVGGTLPVALMPNVQANTLIEPITTVDVFQLYVRRINLTSGTDSSPPPLTPILRVSDRTTGSESLLRESVANILVLRDAGITRWCLSESETRPETTESACDSTATGEGTSNGWYLRRPTLYTLRPGPDGPRKLHLWVADQNLKINLSPAKIEFALDSTPPAPAVVSAVNTADTAVANMTVTHPAESDVADWCVFERATSGTAVAKPKLTDNCWKWTDNDSKPTTVGFKERGAREVYVFVKDKAGNISAASTKVDVNNQHDAISYAKLIDAAGGPSAVFKNRCFTCHGSSTAPGFTKLTLFEYQSALEVVESGVLITRINNPLSPMPNVNGGLMPQRERDLIRLWTMPETGDRPLE